MSTSLKIAKYGSGHELIFADAISGIELSGFAMSRC